jgi:hypothetical protein
MLNFQIPYECSVGVLYQALHRGQALAPLQAEMAEKARGVDLLEGTGVACVLLHAHVNTRIDRHHVKATGVTVDDAWRMLDKDTFWAHVDVDLTQWTPKSGERTPEEALAGAMPVLAYAGWLGFAQAAVELGVRRQRVEEFLAGSPVLPGALGPRSRRGKPRAPRAEVLEVQVRFRTDHPNDQSIERHRVSEVLSRAAALEELGTYEGGSSSNEHFEFAFSVSDRAKAKASFLEALIEAGVERDTISFHTEA